jgi:uncharacterized protein (DUF1697 family)
MSKYAAFLRGINVGGHRTTNAELRSLFEAMGFSDVHSFRASGNVIFTADADPPPKLTAHIEAGLAASLGYQVTTFLRVTDELRSIADAHPFAPEQLQASTGKLQVAMLSERPRASIQKAVLALGSDRDRLAVGTRELFWLPSGGMMESALDLKEIERLLGSVTLRTKNTVEQIADRHFAA